MNLDRETDFGKYNFYDCDSYALFTLASERFQPSFVGKKASQLATFFNRSRKAFDPRRTKVWKEIGPTLKAFGAPVTVLDVGAYIGTFCIPLAFSAKVEGVEIKIHSFEPGPTQALLEINVDANGLFDVVAVHRSAISSFDGYTIYTFSDGGSIGGNVFASASESSKERVAPVRTIDSFCKDIEGPLFIKLDTQGHEPHIMHHAKRIISEQRAVWLIEFLTWCGRLQLSDTSFADMLLREFHIFDGNRQIGKETMPDFLNEVTQERPEWPICC